ncbi:unannotated protein [freshwater metagenome]|uniref:Unannotated protein n=1 Tax=freshwater metagenome TaxID=449393 RepID=A0A6J5YYB3_9ZZZZ|nr:hypothetical protein [Actinomycetota bacterium]
MIRKFLALLATFALAGGLALPAGAADIPDEQLNAPRPPVENTGGYSGVFYDDQRTLNGAFTYVEAWSGADDGMTCLSSQEEPCKSSNNLFYETPLSPCSDTRTRDCVTNLSGKVGDDHPISATLLETLTSTTYGLSTNGRNRYNTPFIGDIKRHIPDSGNVSLWKIPGMEHQGGEQYLLIPMVSSQFQNVAGTAPANLDVGIFAVSKLPIEGAQIDTCFFVTKTSCFKRWPFQQKSTFSISIKTGTKIIGWFHGRLSSPELRSRKTDDSQTLITVKGSVIDVPTLAVWAKNTELPSELNALIEAEFVARGKQFAGSGYYIGNPKDRSTQTVLDDRNPSFDEKLFDRYLLWVGVAKDKAYATVSTWSFRTMENGNDYGNCIGESEIAGIVTTNSNAYISGPPKFKNSELTYRVASPHYDSKGLVQVGSYDLAIRSDIARCIYGFTAAPIQASVSVTYTDGDARSATNLVSEKDNWISLSAKGFTYSSPTLRVKLSQKKNQSYSITCTKGKTSKKVTGVNPKCPKGYVKK